MTSQIWDLPERQISPSSLIGDIESRRCDRVHCRYRTVAPARGSCLGEGVSDQQVSWRCETLFDSGLDIISEHTGWKSYGILPWFDDAVRLPAEDSEDLGREKKGPKSSGSFKIAVPVFPRIANFDDLDALKSEPGVTLQMIERGTPIPADTDLVIIPGSKSTIADLNALRSEGWDVDILAHARRGGFVLGLCGGYQMLGKKIADPEGVETVKGSVCDGLGLLDLETVMAGEKRTVQVSGTHVDSGLEMSGYEIHVGRSEGPDCVRPLFHIEGKDEGAISPDGRIMGCYIHGLFNSDAFRSAFLKRLGASTGGHNYHQMVEDTLDALADHLAQFLDVDGLLEIASEGMTKTPD